MYSIYVEDFMVKDVKFIYHKMTYEQLKNLLLEAKTLVRFPLVDNPKRRILLGSVSRLQLIKLIEQQIGRKRRMQVATMRVKAAQAKAREDALRDELDKLARFQVRPTSDVLVIPQLYGKVNCFFFLCDKQLSCLLVFTCIDSQMLLVCIEEIS